MKVFCETYKFRSLVKEVTCFKNPENQSCIDLILTNKHLRFQRPCAIETNFHKMLLVVIKMHSLKRNHVSLHTENIKTFT